MTRCFVPLLLTTVLAACEVGPDFHSPRGPSPQRYTEAALADRTVPVRTIGGDAQVIGIGRDVAGEWWGLFRSPALTALVARAFAANPGLEAARQSLRNAQELALAQWSGLLPTVGGTLAGTTEQIPGASAGIPNEVLRYGYYDAHLSFAYNFDVWGGVRRGIENRLALVDDQRALLEATYLTLTGNVVASAINIASLRAQIDVQQRLIEAERSYLSTVQQQFALGGASGTDVALQQAQVAQQEALLPPLETSLAQARDALASYVGAVPAEAALPEFDLDQLTLPGALPLSLPASLLAERPDIRQADANLHAATALVGVAVANRLPQISISPELGAQAAQIGQLATPGAGLASLLVQATQPIFEGGALLHQQRAAVATMRQQAALWQQTVIGAFQNVADVLVQLQNDSRLLASQLAAEQAASRALSLAEMQYKLGGASYITVLTAEVTEQQAAINLVRAQASRFLDTSALFVALGGGWWNRNDVPPPPDDLLHSLLPWSRS